MASRLALFATAFVLAGLSAGCNSKEPTTPNSPTAKPAVTLKTAGPLPDNGYKAEITAPEAPSKLRAGQKETITMKVKNASDVVWWQRGGETTDRTDNKFYIAAGSRWLDKDGKPTSEEEGHNGIPKDLRPGEETEMTLEITAPKQPGEYLLNLDMVQEGVCWFGDKGSPTTKVNVTVVK
jgi:hypothetical protein